jgi:hypothetical protein
MRKSPKEQHLDAAEEEFRNLLFACLEECSKGRWGLFGQNDHVESARYLEWPEAERLKELALEIQAVRKEFGESNALCERFAYYCQLRGANVPGEPRLSIAFLEEIRTK